MATMMRRLSRSVLCAPTNVHTAAMLRDRLTDIASVSPRMGLFTVCILPQTPSATNPRAGRPGGVAAGVSAMLNTFCGIQELLPNGRSIHQLAVSSMTWPEILRDVGGLQQMSSPRRTALMAWERRYHWAPV